MKKLMIALAVAAIAVASQAATVKWTASDATKGIALGSLNGNTSVAANGATYTTSLASLTASLYVYAVAEGGGIGDLIGKQEGVTVSYQYTGERGAQANFNNVGGLVANTDYKWELIITGTQKDMATYSDDAWDYSAAKISATLKGDLHTSPAGATTFSNASPTAWTVSGATAVPEPTSGLLLVLGIAGLALRRRRA